MKSLVCVLSIMAVFSASCGGGYDSNSGAAPTIHVDGSSTVFPISEAVAEEFQNANPGIRVTVGISGTGGGFKKFIAGETDINDASRTIKDSEIAQAKSQGIEFIELPVAFDGISVVVNPNNQFVHTLTTEELRTIWQPGSTVQKWSDVRQNWPDQSITLYGPGTASGTFDYFTEAINGKSQACRADFTASEDDNVLVQGIAGDENALGFFGYAYYSENQAKLKLVLIDDGTGPVSPTPTSINNGTYRPLSRPIFIYVRKGAAKREEVEKFVKFYLREAPVLVKEVGYVPLPSDVYSLVLKRFVNRDTGSVFGGKNVVGASLQDLLAD